MTNSAYNGKTLVLSFRILNTNITISCTHIQGEICTCTIYMYLLLTTYIYSVNWMWSKFRMDGYFWDDERKFATTKNVLCRQFVHTRTVYLPRKYLTIYQPTLCRYMYRIKIRTLYGICIDLSKFEVQCIYLVCCWYMQRI